MLCRSRILSSHEIASLIQAGSEKNEFPPAGGSERALLPAMSHAVRSANRSFSSSGIPAGVEIEDVVQFGDDGFVDAFPFRPRSERIKSGSRYPGCRMVP